MSTAAWLLIGTIVTAAGGVLTTWLLIRQQGRQTRTTDAQQIIDQLQEMRGVDEERHRHEVAQMEARNERAMSEVRSEIADLRGRVLRMESRELAFFDYVAALRFHIEQKLGPPPPPWPAALMNRD